MKKMVKVILAAAAVMALAVPAMAADKLIVKGTDGTTTLVSITDTGYITLPATSGRGASFSNAGANGALLNFGLLSVNADQTVPSGGVALQMVPRGAGYNANIKAQMTVFGTDYIADPVNYEGLVLRATGSAYSINSAKGGVGLNRPIQFQIQNQAKMTLDITGYVGIGTTTPKSAFHVVGLPTYASNTAATTGGLTAGAFYTDGAGNVKVVY